MAIVSWHLLKIGHCVHSKFMTMQGADFCDAEFPALVGLVIHETFGPILFDTGYDKEFFTATANFPEKLYRLTLPVTFDDGDDITKNLADYGLGSDDIRGVVLSHFHGDHISGLKNFPNGKIFCASAGLKKIMGFNGVLGRINSTRNGLLPSLLPDDIAARSVFFEDLKQSKIPQYLEPFEWGVDLLGDNTMFAVELPGHCVGHWGLVIIPKDSVPVFFVGDAAWSTDAISKNIPPPAITTTLLGNTKEYRKTLWGLNNIMKNVGGDIEIIPSHCDDAKKKWVKDV